MELAQGRLFCIWLKPPMRLPYLRIEVRGNQVEARQCAVCPKSNNNPVAGSSIGWENCALSVRTDKVHSAEATAAVPSVTERYQR
jgi:hypothetical protein